MPANDLVVRWAEAVDLPRLEEFWHRQYGADSVQAVPGRASWLFADQPAGLCTAIVEARGRLVACCGHVVQSVQLGAQSTVEAAFGVDFMVHSDHRRQGLGARILDLRLDRFDLSLSTGQSGGMAALYRRERAVDLGPFQLARTLRRPVLSTSPRNLARDVVVGLAALGRPRIQGTRELLSPQEAAGLAGALLQADEPWLSWRFLDSPYRDYQAWALDYQGARALLFSRRQGDQEIIVHLHSDFGVSEALALAARTSPATAVDALVCGTGLNRRFRQAGYLVRPYGARLIAASRRESVIEQLSPGAVDLFASAADADLIRYPDIPKR